MAKECELTSKTYNEIMVVPAGAKVAGEMELNQKTLGFYFTEFTAAMLALGDSATLIVDGESVTVTKKSGEIWVAGDPIFWLETTSNFTNVDDGSGKLVGKAREAAANLAIIGHVLMKDYYPVQRGMQIGTASIPYKIAVDDPMFSAFVTRVVALDTGHDKVLRMQYTSNVKSPNVSVIEGKIDFKINGYSHNLAHVFCSTIAFPGSLVQRGTYTGHQVNIECPENCDLASAGIPVSLMRLNNSGVKKLHFDLAGFLFDLQGLTAGGGRMFKTFEANTPKFDASLRIIIGTKAYWILLADNDTGG